MTELIRKVVFFPSVLIKNVPEHQSKHLAKRTAHSTAHSTQPKAQSPKRFHPHQVADEKSTSGTIAVPLLFLFSTAYPWTVSRFGALTATK